MPVPVPGMKRKLAMRVLRVAPVVTCNSVPAPAPCVMVTPFGEAPRMVICLVVEIPLVHVHDPFGMTTVSPRAAAFTAALTSTAAQLAALIVAPPEPPASGVIVGPLSTMGVGADASAMGGAPASEDVC